MLSAAMDDAVTKAGVWSPLPRSPGVTRPSTDSCAAGETRPTAPRAAASTPNTAMVQPEAERGRLTGSAHRPLLVRPARAGPDLQAGAVGGVVAGHVQALVGLRVDDVAGGGDDPFLGGGAVA